MLSRSFPNPQASQPLQSQIPWLKQQPVVQPGVTPQSQVPLPDLIQASQPDRQAVFRIHSLERRYFL